MLKPFQDLVSSTAPTTRALLVVIAVVGCGDDVTIVMDGSGGADGTDGSGSNAESSASSGGADETADETAGEGGGEDGGPPCGFEGMLGGTGDYELVMLPAEGTTDQHFTFDPSVDCVLEGIYDGDAPDAGSPLLNDDPVVSGFDVFIYHPQNISGDWPSGLSERPAVFFAPAAGILPHLVDGDGEDESDHRYRELMRTLVEAGFVVFGIEPNSNDGMNSGRRRAALACVMNWARSEWDPGDRLSEYMVVMGHSRGGGGAYLLTQDLLDGDDLPSPETAPALWDWRQCALATFAQRFGPGASQDPTDVTPVDQESAPPFLSILSASDADTKTEGILAYDNRFSETLAHNMTTVDQFDENVLVVHGLNHGAWGGFVAGENPIGRYYVEQFLRWQMMGEDQSRRRFMDLIDVDADSCAFDDLPFSDNSDCSDEDPGTLCDWDDALEVYYRGCQGETPPDVCGDLDLVGLGRPLIRADFAQGDGLVGARRYVVDSLDHAAPSCLSSDGTGIENSSSGGLITVTSEVDEVGPCVCVQAFDALVDGVTDAGIPEACDPASALAGPGTTADSFGGDEFVAHYGAGMLVRFGQAFGPATIRWSLLDAEDEGDDSRALDISDYTHVSVRLGNYVVEPDDTPTYCDGPQVPDEFVVDVGIEDVHGVGEHVIATAPLVESDVRYEAGSPASCNSTHFMQTVRIPIARYCAEGMFDPFSARAITLAFDDPAAAHIALVDSIELVRDPNGASLVAACSGEELDPCASAAPSGWNCEATATLVATEFSCAGEPVSAACALADIVETDVDLPVIDEGTLDEFAGWVVHVPRGWIRDPNDPTSSELDDVSARCIAACELEYVDRPEIALNCSDTGAFEAPTLRDVDDIGPRVALTDARSNGSGIFTGESLDCDLRDECTDAFDEDLAAARTRRATSAGQPLGRGEEWHLAVEGAVEADSSSATAAVMASLSGTIGYSECKGGNADGPCPFYLGSLELELGEPLTLAVECGGPPEVHVLDELSLRLVQPAFGIAEEDTDWRGFPSGSLVVEAEGIVDGHTFSALGPIRRDLQLIAADGWAQLQGTGGSYVELTMPCGEGTTDVVAWLGFSAVDWPGEPPSVSIDVPSSVSCPSAVTLAKTVTDQENDIATVRWRIDGVLMDEAVSEVTFTVGHTLEATVRDERGASRTKAKTVTCE